MGRWGEEKAAQYLKNEGFEIIEQNYKAKRLGEIDLIVKENNQLIFVEVKTRKSIRYGSPVEAVNNNKIETLKYIAKYYLAVDGKKYNNYVFRFDLITLYIPVLTKNIKYYKLKHYKNII